MAQPATEFVLYVKTPDGSLREISSFTLRPGDVKYIKASDGPDMTDMVRKAAPYDPDKPVADLADL